MEIRRWQFILSERYRVVIQGNWHDASCLFLIGEWNSYLRKPHVHTVSDSNALVKAGMVKAGMGKAVSWIGRL
jgi:hypothetical protein